jgi:DNA-binding ferritin-like protein
MDTTHRATKLIADLLATLRATQWIHWTGHWQASGNPYYGDHLLLQRLYEGLNDEIDTLAEKMVAMYGIDSVNPAAQAELFNRIVQRLSKEQSPILRSLNTELKLMGMLEATFKELEAMGKLSLGLNDFIAAAANNHETYVYLLKQRTR